MPKKTSPKKVTKGETALSRIISYSKDQVKRSVTQRYVKRGGLQQVASDIRELRKMLNTEEKHFDTVTAATTVTSTSSQVLAIGSMAEGSDSNQRTGRSIKIVRTDLNLVFTYSTGTPATTSIQNQYFNWYYVKYLKSAAGAGQTPFGISEFLNQDPGSNYTPISLPNPDTNENFQVLASGQIEVDLPDATTALSSRFKIITLQVDRVFHQTYNGSTAASISDNMCFLVFTALNAINAGGASNVAFGVRQWYVDN
jgi:hypothetical protein